MSTKPKLLSYRGKMTKNAYILIMILLTGIVFFACETDDSLETDPELIPFFELFAEEGAKRGFVVDYEEARIEGLIQDILDGNVQGQCFRNEKKPRKVIIDTEYWNTATQLRKEFIIFHELGHCFLNRDHLNTSDASGNCVSIMHANPGVCNFFLTEENKEQYLDELFAN